MAVNIWQEIHESDLMRESHLGKRFSIHVEQDGIELILAGFFDETKGRLCYLNEAFLYIITKDGTISFNKPANSNFFACVDDIKEQYLFDNKLAFKTMSHKSVHIDKEKDLYADLELFKLIRSDESVAKIAKSKNPNLVDKIQDDQYISDLTVCEPNNKHLNVEGLEFELDHYKSRHIKKADIEPIVFQRTLCSGGRISNDKDFMKMHLINFALGLFGTGLSVLAFIALFIFPPTAFLMAFIVSVCFTVLLWINFVLWIDDQQTTHDKHADNNYNN